MIKTVQIVRKIFEFFLKQKPSDFLKQSKKIRLLFVKMINFTKLLDMYIFFPVFLSILDRIGKKLQSYVGNLQPVYLLFAFLVFNLLSILFL